MSGFLRGLTLFVGLGRRRRRGMTRKGNTNETRQPKAVCDVPQTLRGPVFDRMRLRLAIAFDDGDRMESHRSCENCPLIRSPGSFGFNADLKIGVSSNAHALMGF